MEIADRAVEVHLTIGSISALRVLLNQEIARIERWALIHGSQAIPTVLRDIQDYLEQVRLLQGQVTAGWNSAVCNEAARATRMQGRGRQSQPHHRRTELGSMPG
jgi:hypothetical protein